MKKEYSKILELPKDYLNKWDTLLNMDNIDYDEYKWGEYSTVACWTVKFEDGCECDIKVNTNGREDKDLFCEAVLFDEEGHELYFTDPEYEVSGKWNLSSKDADYQIDVIGI